MFLLDTSVLSALTNPNHTSHTNARAFRTQCATQERELYLCVISIAEMRFGLSMYEARMPRPSETVLNEIRERIHAAMTLSEPIEITRHVANEHGQLRSKWAWICSPQKAAQGKLKGNPPERWSDDWPASKLQITENDIWIAAIALTHDLTLVTCDKDFDNLAKADSQLKILRI